MKRNAFTAMLAAVVALTAVSGAVLPANAPLSLSANAAAVREEEKPVSGHSGIYTYLKYPKYIEIESVSTSPVGRVEIPAKLEGLPVTVIGKEGFLDCTEMTELVIPDSVLYMNMGAVSGCSKLKKVQLPKKLTALPARAFENCTSLETIALPDSITEINAYAFEGCSALKEINIPDAVTLLGSGAFRRCSALTKATLGKGIKEIGNQTFAMCH